MTVFLIITLLVQVAIVIFILSRITKGSKDLTALEEKLQRIFEILSNYKVTKKISVKLRKVLVKDERPTSKSILNLTNKEAREFLLQEESYVTFRLPPYIKFNQLITQIVSKLGTGCVKNYFVTDKSKHPNKLEDVNFKLMSNKDGKHDWRPFEIVHPALYVDMVNQLTKVDNWLEIVNRFKFFEKNSIVECKSIPRKSLSAQSDQAENVNNWLDTVEKQSISLSIEFEYLYKTDISDCYGSIYTHSVSWALYSKNWCKDNLTKKAYTGSLGKYIENYLQNIHHQQTNGIPQGNVLSDLIAELVLGYIDTLFTERIMKLTDAKDLKIIRFRDDYRIFTNDKRKGDTALKILSETLSDFNFKLSKGKTSASNDVISESIKADKRIWKTNYSKNNSKSILQKLISLLQFSIEHPNTGTLKRELTTLHKNIFKWNYFKQDLNVLIAYTVEIAAKNPGCYPECSALLSKFVNFMEQDERICILNSIKTKLDSIPNNGYLEIWLQRILLKYDIKVSYTNKICRAVDKRIFDIWDSSWLHKDFQKLIQTAKIIDDSVIKSMDEVIQPVEFELYNEEYNR